MSMPIRRISFSADTHSDADHGEWEKTVSAAALVGNLVYVLVLGFGWDQDHPWRPWPWFTRRPTERGNRIATLSCCGFFVTVGRSA